MGKSVLLALAGGLASALMAAAAFGGGVGMLIAYFAPLPLLLIGLAGGRSAIGLAAAVGTVGCLTAAGLAPAAVFLALTALPSWLVVHEALRPGVDEAGVPGFAPVGRALAILACLIASALVGISLAAGAGDGLEAAIHGHLDEVFAASLTGLDDAARADLAGSVAPLFLGLSAAIWLLMITLNAGIAQSLLARRRLAIRPRPAWSALALPAWFAWPLVGAAVLALVAPGDIAFLARNVVLVLAAAYFLQGLATLHGLSRGRPGRRPMLILLYFIIGIAFVFAAPVIAGIGMIDQWAGLRRPPAPPAGLKIKE